MLEEAYEHYAAQADGAGLTATVAELAWITLVRGEYGRAQELWEQALSLAREAGDRQTEARALTGLARGLAESGHDARAGQLAREALELRRELGDARNVADSLATLGRVELLAHHDEQARKLLDESLSLARELDDHLREAEALYFLVLVALQEGSTQEAVATLGKRLALCRDLGDRLGIAECLDVLGGVAALRHEGLAAARLFGAADGVRRSIGAAPWTAERARREHHEGMACSYLDRVTFEQHKAEACAMGLGDAISLAEESAVALAGSA
jgi:tetratricopeptide (TPR) repeat protein